MERTKVQNKSQKQVYLGSNLSSTQFEIDENAYGLIIDRLTDLYNNPLLSAIREIISNAIDSTVEAGSSKDIEIHCPSKMEPWFEVTDYGLGMDKETLEQVYTKFGASTKGSNLNQIGSYGLGAKAPLAYTNILTIRSVKDGKVTSGIISRDDKGIFMSLYEPEVTDEPNGFTIQFNILSDDVEQAQDILNDFANNSYIVSGVEFKFTNLIGKSEEEEELFRLNDIELPTGDKLRFYISERGIGHVIRQNMLNYPYKFVTQSAKYNLQGFLYDLPSDEYNDNSIKNMFVVELLPGYVDFNSSRDSITTTEKTNSFKDFMNNYLANLPLEELNVISPITILDSLYKYLGYNAPSELYSLLTDNLPSFKEFVEEQDFSKVISLHEVYYSNGFQANVYYDDDYVYVRNGGLTEVRNVTEEVTTNTVYDSSIVDNFIIRSKRYNDRDIVLYNVEDSLSALKVRKRMMDELQLDNSDSIRVVSFKGTKEEALDSFSHFPGKTYFLDYKYLLNKSNNSRNNRDVELTAFRVGTHDIVGNEIEGGSNSIRKKYIEEIIALPKDYQVFIAHNSGENNTYMSIMYRELSTLGLGRLLTYYKLNDTDIVEGKPILLITLKRKGDLTKVIEHFDNVFLLRFYDTENKTQKSFAESFKKVTGREPLFLYDLEYKYELHSIVKGDSSYEERMEVLDKVKGVSKDKIAHYTQLNNVKEMYTELDERYLDKVEEEIKHIGKHFSFDKEDINYAIELVNKYQGISDEEKEDLQLYARFSDAYPRYINNNNSKQNSSNNIFRIIKSRNKFNKKVEKLVNNLDKYVEYILENEQSPSMYDLTNRIGRLEWED